MSDQVPFRNSSATTPHAQRSSDLDHDTVRGRNTPHDEIDRIETQFHQAMQNRLADVTLRSVTAEARKAERDQLIRMLRERLTERGLYATWLESEVETRNQRINELFETARRAAEDLQRAEAELETLRAAPVRHAITRSTQQVIRTARALRSRINAFWLIVISQVQRFGLLDSHAGQSTEVVASVDSEDARQVMESPTIEKDAGRSEPNRGGLTRDRNDLLRWIPPRRDPYDVWLRNHASDSEELLAQWKQLENRPTFSVIVPQGHIDPHHLRETVASLRIQLYPDREVLLVGGAETTAATIGGQATLFLESEGNFEALRAAAEQCSGDYLLFINHRACLAKEALLEFARSIVATPAPPDLIFADEDRIDSNGHRFNPQFRPSWSPELMLAYNAIGGTFAVRRSMYDAVGGLRPEFGEAWPYDLALRIAECTDRIVRVPRVLVSIPADPDADDPVDSCPVETLRHSALALASAIERREIDARVSQPSWASRLRVPVFELDFPERGPKVAILIPTRDRVDLLQRCLDSIRDRTTYEDYEIVVIDNGSEEPGTLEFFAQLGPRCRVIRIENGEYGFSYARIHNMAITQLEDSFEFVVLLNNDTEVVRSEWLGQLVGYGQLPGVGAVGARLLYPDGRIQHAGIVTDLFEGGPGHLFKGLPWWHTDVQFFARVTRNVSAVTAACLLVRTSTYLRIGGLDEHQFAVGFNDVDFCLRLGEVGLRCVYAPRAELMHFEGASRGFALDLQEQERFLDRWGDRADPYHHPALIRDDHRPGLRTRSPGGPVPIKDQPVRVLVDLDRLDGRGPSEFVRNLLEGYRQRGKIIPEVCCRIDGAMGTMLRNLGFPVSIVSNHDARDLADHAQIMADAFRENGYDLIHVVGLDRFATVHAARLAGIPSLWTLREAIDFRDAFLTLDDDEARAAIEAFSEASCVVFPAQNVRNLYAPVETSWNFEVIREAGRPVVGLPSRHDARSRQGLSPSTVVLSCLHDADDDQVGIFLDQFATLVRAGRDVVAMVLGVPELGRWLAGNELSRTLGRRVRFVSLAEGNGLNDALAASDVLVNVSPRDLSPEIVSLKHTLQRPLIQSEVVGIHEYVRTDPTVLLFDPTDPETLRIQMESVLDTPDLGLHRGEIGGDRMYQNMILAYERLSLQAIRASAVLTRARERVA